MKTVILITAAILTATSTWACDIPKPNPSNVQNQRQSQHQQQTAIGIGVGIGQGGQGGNAYINEQREVLPAMPVNPQPFPLLNGRIGEFPTRHNVYMNRCQPNDTLVDVVAVEDSTSWTGATSIRYEDVNKMVLNVVEKYKGDSRHLCYWVGFKDASNGGGVGGGASAAASSGNTFMATGAAIVPGYNGATFNPKFFIEVLEVIPAPVSIAKLSDVPDKPIKNAAVNPEPSGVIVLQSPCPPCPEVKKPVKKHHRKGCREKIEYNYPCK